MNHRTAVSLLPDLGTATLDPATEAELTEHASRCPSCRDWLRTYETLAETLRSDPDPAEDHVERDLLALCVVRPEEMQESDREELRRHLAACARCRENLELTQAAVANARPRRADVTSRDTPARPLGPWRYGLAAALVIALLGAGLHVTGLLVGRDGSTPLYPEAGGVQAGDPDTGEAVRDLSGEDLEGTRVIGGDRTLVLSKLTVKPGADVTLHADEVVAFGDGFRVASGARLRVGSARSSQRPTPRQAPLHETSPADGGAQRPSDESIDASEREP